jgi:protein-tyrosine-phosphatase
VSTSALPRALFVCVQNAGRSQMAAAFWEQLGGRARSAGSHPAERVHPEVVEAMRETDLDVAGRTPRQLTDDDAAWAEVVVTMGCGDACPFIPGRRYLDWDLDDPAGKDLDTVRAVRDEIRHRISELAGQPGASRRRRGRAADRRLRSWTRPQPGGGPVR